MAKDHERALLEHDDEFTTSNGVATSVNQRHEPAVPLERELAVRLNRRGERGATAMSITWI